MHSRNHRFFLTTAAFGLASFLAGAPVANAQWEFAPTDGSSIKFGYLAQPTAEFLDSGSDTSQNLFFRRLRLLAGGKINDKISFFFETDSANLGKGEPDGTKNSGDILMQDFVISYMPQSEAFILDIGQLLAAVTYNSNQSAASLMATDYGPYSFIWAGALDTRVGRDYGVRARGYLLNDRLEYRASILQGNRGTDSTSDLRIFGRLMFSVLGEPHKGLFYAGTNLGKKQQLSVGASFDTQEEYETFSVDAFWDQPLAGGNAVTAQVNWSSLDGDTFLTALPEQENLFVEAGFYFGGMKLLPFVQYAETDFDSGALADQDKWQVGLGYMFSGHNGNLKLSYGETSTDGGEDTDEIKLQLQIFKF